MIKPVNGHILVQPVVHESFMAQQKETFEEIGIVLDTDSSLPLPIKLGDKVYFDAWLAAKFPSEKPDEYYWLVKWDDVRGVEHA